MNVDEMELVSQLRDVTPLHPEAYERARTTLRAAMAEPGPARVPELVPVPGGAPVRRAGSSRRRNRRLRPVGTLGKVGIGAGIGAVAAGVAVALVATSTPQPTAPAGSTSHAAKAPAVSSKLASLAAVIKASNGNLPGNASLVIQTQRLNSTPPGGGVTYNLYTDSGLYYAADNKEGLASAVAHHDSLAGMFASSVVAAARYAATGDLTTARARMVSAGPPNDIELLLRLSPAARKKRWEKDIAKERAIFRAKGVKPPATPTDSALQLDVDNWVWFNSVNALTEGAGNPQVREGVLRLMSTIPEVTVTNSTTGGQPALTLTAGTALNPGSGLPAQVVTISATTGMPISSVFGSPGQKLYSATTFRVSRVWLAAIEAGRF